MSSPVSDPWMVTHPATPTIPDMRKQRRTWHAATPHKVSSPADDVPSLQITHFTKKQIVCFDVVKFGKSRKRHLKLINPHDYPQTVELERISPKKGFFLNDKMWEIPPNQELLIPIFWTPPEEGSFRDLITFLCEGAFRLQVILLGTAEDATRKVSGRRSTFLVKRKSLAKPLRTQNGLGQKKKKKHSLQTTPKPVGKENFNSTDVNLPKVDMLPGTQRETMVFKAANATVPTKLKAERKENSNYGRDLNETAFNNRTTFNALKELRNAVAPIQNVPLQNIARETLVVCEGMSPLLQSKKSKARTKKGNFKGSPERGRSSEDFVRELKGTEVKVHHSSSDNHSSPLVVVGVSKRALFTDVEAGKGIGDRQPDQDSVITSDAGDEETNEDYSREKKIDADHVNVIHDEDSKEDDDSFEDSLEAKSEEKNSSCEVDSVRCTEVPEENGDRVVDADGRGDSGEREEALEDSATGEKKEGRMDEEVDIGEGGGGGGIRQDQII